MYAASAGRRACAFLSTSPACSPARPRASTPVRTPGRHASQISPNSTRSGENVEDATEHDDVCDSSGLPLVKTAMAFAKQRLWMPEVCTIVLRGCALPLQVVLQSLFTLLVECIRTTAARQVSQLSLMNWPGHELSLFAICSLDPYSQSLLIVCALFNWHGLRLLVSRAAQGPRLVG